MLDSVIKFFLEKRLVAIILLVLIIGYGLSVLPFDIPHGLPSDPVPVDAIPDIGENQQIVFTSWPGRSPRDVEDQITYPLTVNLMGIPGVKTIRASSMLGFSSIYVIFDEKVDFYWSRSRILEKLASIKKQIPDGVSPVIGPDATALGQIFWYTVEGEGFSLEELRSIQDWTIKFALQSVDGVSEVGSVGGFVKEYQIDIDPEALEAYNISIPEIVNTVKQSNLDVGAGTLEINKAEYLIRGIGFIKSLADIKNSVIKAVNGTPITLEQVAKIKFGPAPRRGVLDKSGAEAVGAVVVTRFGANPLEVIQKVKNKIKEISQGLPSRRLANGTMSKVKIVPFYDRTKLIGETLGTLQDALSQQIIITILVVSVMLFHLSSSFLISSLLPIAVLMTFIAMKLTGVDANLMSLAGIAIAIGTMVDMGVILCENTVKKIEEDASKNVSLLSSIYEATSEVGSAVLTAVSTTVVGFLPVFAMTGAEGKLFKPLAYTKSYALGASLFIALIFIPVAASFVFKKRQTSSKTWIGVTIAGILASLFSSFIATILVTAGITGLIWNSLSEKHKKLVNDYSTWLFALAAIFSLSYLWMPLGISKGFFLNLLAVFLACSFILGSFNLFMKFYAPLLSYFLNNKLIFACIPLCILLWGAMVWQGSSNVLGWVPKIFSPLKLDKFIKESYLWNKLDESFPGLGREFMPPLDEGSFLLMPTTMPHASISEAKEILRQQDIAISNIPEVESVTGKIGRVDSPLDPAPLSMIETIISYKSEYGEVDPNTGKRKRQWREHIKTPDDIWSEIVKVSKIPGTTSAPRLQPIAARLVMLQTGIRAPMGLQISGPDLESVEKAGYLMEKELKNIEGIDPTTVAADRIVGKPYLEIKIDRAAAARHGIRILEIQNLIETALGGKPIAYTVEGRERYAVRVRFARELRDNPDLISRLPITSSSRRRIPLGDLAQINFVRGPQVIKSENSFTVGYVIFDKTPGSAETDVVENAQKHLARLITDGKIVLPANTSFKFIGNYQNQVRSEHRLKVILPISLLIIFLILYLQFGSVSVTFLVFTGITIAWSGGFILIWLYSKPWFMDFGIFGNGIRDLFNMHAMNLSVAVWVGFIALFGIASDDGVVMATYLNESLKENEPTDEKQLKAAVLEAGLKRIRPCLMTTATTILALLPVLTSTGRGADVMIPMAIPTFGGMCIELVTLFVVPVGYCLLKEIELKTNTKIKP